MVPDRQHLQPQDVEEGAGQALLLLARREARLTVQPVPDVSQERVYPSEGRGIYFGKLFKSFPHGYILAKIKFPQGNCLFELLRGFYNYNSTVIQFQE